jgi:diamine N-acetyltransferase
VTFSVRSARPTDSALIFTLVKELAAYEKLVVHANEEAIARALFCEAPRLFCNIADWEGETAGFSTWFLNYSTFRGTHGIYIEDLFVRPAYRGRGVGRALIAQLARSCVEVGYGRIEWAVLDWNAPAIAFYRSIGAEVLDQWRICRLSGEALKRVAG